MRYIFSILLLTISVSGFSQTRYSRSELEQMSKERLVDLVLQWQGDAVEEDCETQNARTATSFQILHVYRHSGYSDDGTLRWPNGNVFMLRHSGYSDDYTFYYPDGRLMLLGHSGYSDNGTVRWSNGNTMMLRHSGYSDDGTVFHSNGNTWLLRHSGYSDDRQRFGDPTDSLQGDGYFTKARLTSSDSVLATTTVEGSGYTLKIVVDGSEGSVTVKECF